MEYIHLVLNLIIGKINANSESLGGLCTEMAELTSSQQAALLSRGDAEGESGELKILQDKARDLVRNVQALEDFKTTKVDVADAVIDVASVIGLQVVEILKRIAKLEDTPPSSAPLSDRSPVILLSNILIDEEGAEVMSLRDPMLSVQC